jgi:hypothetical protein
MTATTAKAEAGIVVVTKENDATTGDINEDIRRVRNA